MRDLAKFTNMRSSNGHWDSDELTSIRSPEGVPDAQATSEMSVVPRPPNIDSAVHGEDETQPVLPAANERVRNGHDALCAITEQSEPLRQAQSRVEELTCANRRKDEFLAMLSHELSSPLSAIHHAVRYLGTQSGEAATQQRMQALIERQLTRMTHLVQELRDVSLIASGQLHLQRERVDLRDIVRHTVETLEWEIQERNHRLAIHLPGGPVWLLADARRLEQVFVNLLANASRYTDEGGELAVRVQAKDGEAIIQVRDSGIGIAPESLPQIFDLFRQGNAADRRSGVGFGVGLAVVRNLIELHRGSVVAASAGVGQGSEFTVRLPTTE
jgi:signal transduction histidine kinase